MDRNGRFECKITFFGNSTVADADRVLRNIVKTIEKIFDFPNKRAYEFWLTFFCGGYGEFDGLASRAVDILRKRYPDVGIKKYFVAPYLDPSYLKKLEFIKEYYDEIIYPPIENVPPQFAILERNHWMISNSDIGIYYCQYKYGNTGKLLSYAKSKSLELWEVR